MELGFGYRTKLTGLDPDEAAAMGFLLTLPPRDLVDLGLAPAAIRAQAKLREAFPDQTRAYMARAQTLFRIAPAVLPAKDPRRNALALAVREARIVHLKSRSRDPIAVHPVAVLILPEGWAVQDQITNRLWPEADWGDINISAKRFTSAAPKAGKP